MAQISNPQIMREASAYNLIHGLPPHNPEPSKLNPEPYASVLAAMEYAKLKHDPGHPDVKAAYDALKREVKQQYDHIVSRGMKIEPSEQGYENSHAMMLDVAKNRHLNYQPTGSEMPPNHPLAEIEPTTGRPYNDLFRAVHDYFGHAMHGHQFGPKGEIKAWDEHRRMFTPLAQKALTTETHGQNSWVNFGPHSHLPVKERPYAEQKAAILPTHAYPIV